MPITRSQFNNKKTDDGMKKEIVELLNKDTLIGYSTEEILKYLVDNFIDMYWCAALTASGAEKDVEDALNELVESKMILVNPVKAGSYTIKHYIAKID